MDLGFCLAFKKCGNFIDCFRISIKSIRIAKQDYLAIFNVSLLGIMRCDCFSFKATMLPHVPLVICNLKLNCHAGFIQESQRSHLILNFIIHQNLAFEFCGEIFNDAICLDFTVRTGTFVSFR